MRPIIDANRVVAALLREGTTRKILFETTAELCAPEDLRIEVGRHEEEFLRRSGLPAYEFRRVLDAILAEITWIGSDVIQPFIEAAVRSFKGTHSSDVVYLACAMAIEADGVWSHDKGFDVQKSVRRFTNGEVPRPN